MLQSQHGEFDAGVDVQLDVDVLEVRVDSVRREVHVLSYVPVREAAGHKLGDAELSIGERPPRVRCRAGSQPSDCGQGILGRSGAGLGQIPRWRQIVLSYRAPSRPAALSGGF